MMDEEKATEGRTFDVSGPGLGDLHTTGPAEAVFDLRAPGPMDERLDRIEALLAQLAASNGHGLVPRHSASTYVDEYGVSTKNGTNVGHDDVAGASAVPQGHVVGVHDDHHPHVPFVPGVAGAAGREHVDVRRT